MCGIVGIAHVEGKRRFDAADVLRMADAIPHRGPDDHGVHDGGQVIIGMRRLSIIDLHGGHQPIANEQGNIWVVCNGEIYNYRRLRRDLEALGHRFSTNSDTEVLVHLYEECGDEMLERLEGMFGLALWDAVRRKLIVARDPLGIKPVYFWKFAGGFAFASEIKAFRGLRGFSVAVNERALRDHISIGYAVAPLTIFAGVEKLAPASMLVWQDGCLEVKRYWSLPERADTSRSSDDWIAEIRAGFERAIEDHMVADVPVGAFLSGGIDSSAVAALMAKHSPKPLNTYSIGYDGPSARYYNELPFARLMAQQLASNHREIVVRPNVARLLPKLMWHLEEPISDSSIMTTYLVSELAAESVTVILSGVGGDELFGGYNRYLGSYYNRRYKAVPAWLRRTLLLRLADALPSGRQNRLIDVARLAKRFIRAHELDWGAQYKSYLALAKSDVVAWLAHSTGDCADSLDRVLAEEHVEDELLRLLRVDWQTQLAEDLLLLTDKMTMACSLECRVPFLDKRFVELAATIPAQAKMPNGRLKGLLKDALRGVLPESIISRRKRGFGAPVGEWFKHELAPLRDTLLCRKAVAARGLVNPEAVESVCAAHDAQREDYTDLILVLMNLEVWSRLYLDGRSHDDVAADLAERRLAT